MGVEHGGPARPESRWSHPTVFTKPMLNQNTGPVGSSSRREFLWQFSGGLGGTALASMLGQDQLLAADGALKPRPEFNGGLHHRAKAKRVVQFYMSGAASQCD